MLKYLLCLSVIISIGACKDDNSLEINMTDEALVALFQDIHISNAALLKYKKENRDSVAQIFRSELAEIHNISVERIDFVMEQIQRSPKRYLALEKEAVNNLKELKDSIKATPVLKKESTLQNNMKQR